MLFFPFQALNEEIINRKKNVDQAIKNGQALLKQTTGTLKSVPLSTSVVFKIFILCVECFAYIHICVSHVCLVPQRVLDFPRTGGMGGSEPPDVLGTKLRS